MFALYHSFSRIALVGTLLLLLIRCDKNKEEVNPTKVPETEQLASDDTSPDAPSDTPSGVPSDNPLVALPAPADTTGSEMPATPSDTTGSEPTTTPEKPDDKSSPDLSARQRVIEDYEKNYLNGDFPFLEWDGDATQCQMGTVPQAIYRKTLQRINYFRRQTGLNDDIYFSAEKNRKCQEGALMIHANSQLNHNPPKSWKCYTDDGATALGKANIGNGKRTVERIDAYIRDTGVDNLGHRRWILYSQASEMGYGITSGANALWVVGDAKRNPTADSLDFIAWPPAGYVINKLVYKVWSFSVPKANFSESKVTMTGPDGEVPITATALKNGFGDNTISWPVVGGKPPIGEDITYEIKVSKVKVNGAYQDFSYSVTIIGYSY